MDSVSKTLYIPLYGKAYVSRRGLFLRDEKAEEIWENAGITLTGKAKSRWLACNMGMRAAVFDRWLEEKLKSNPTSVVLHLGCGLDARVLRVPADRWYDVDFPAVISERKKFFQEAGQYRMIAADLREKNWMDPIPGGGMALVVMEGLSMYLTPRELQTLLGQIRGHFDAVQILMDTYTVFAARASHFKNPINEVGVTRVYGLDDPMALEKVTGLHFAGELSLTPEHLIAELPAKEQRIFRFLFGGKMARKIYRLYSYEA